MTDSTPILVSPGGELRLLYSESIDLREVGEVAVRRASHVDPDEAGRWWADLSPVRGLRLGPFARRSEALHAEAAWLIERSLPIG